MTAPVLSRMPFEQRVLVALVAEHAVVDLAQHLARGDARVGELEAVAPAQLLVGTDHRLGQPGVGPLRRAPGACGSSVSGKRKTTQCVIARIVHVRGAPALEAPRCRAATACFSSSVPPARAASSRSSSAQPARARASSRGHRRSCRFSPAAPIRRRQPRDPSAVASTRAPPFSSGSARRRTKSILKRNRSS